MSNIFRSHLFWDVTPYQPVVTAASKDCTALRKSKRSPLGLCDPRDESKIMLQKLDTYLPVDMAYHAINLESSGISLL